MDKYKRKTQAIRKYIKNFYENEFIKKNKFFILICCLLVVLGGGYLAGNIGNSKESVITKLEVALKSGSEKKLSKIVRINNKKVYSKELKNLVEYYRVDSSRVDSVIEKLKNGKNTETFNLQCEERGIGNRYYLDINTYELSVKSNFDKGLFTIDNKNYISGEDSFKGIVPGIYTVYGKLLGEYGDVETSKEIVLMKDEEVEVEFPATKITINSAYDDAEVFINNKDANITVKEAKDIGPIPSDGTVSLYIEKKFPWGTNKSKEINITEKANIFLDIDMENEIMKEDINDACNSFYQSVFEALNSGDKSKIDASTTGVKEKIYNILNKQYIFLKNEYTIKSVNVMGENSEYIYRDGEYRATVVVDVDYEIRKSLFEFKTGDNSKGFFTKLIFKGDKWIVEGVENFSL